MRNIFYALLLSLIAMPAFGQVFDQTKEFYSKTDYTNAMASDTTGYMNFAPADHLVFTGKSTDSAAIVLRYQLRDGVTGNTTSGFTLIDTLLHATNGGASQLIGGLAIATVAGYDQIRFEVDYVTGNGTTSGRVARFYYRFLQK